MKKWFLLMVTAGVPAWAGTPWIEARPAAAIPAENPVPGPRWLPDGDQTEALSADCHWLKLESLAVDGPSSEATRSANVQAWFRRCGGPLQRSSRGSTGDLLRYARLGYSLRTDAALRSVTFRLSDGRLLDGIAAFKPSSRPRPLVVVMCGLFCNSADGMTARAFTMQLFEEGPFHVLMLASPSGSVFSRTNQALALAGFDGGAQIMDVVRQVMASDLRARISTVHLMGVSLGAHAAEYAALYASYPENGLPKIAGVTAICPVVDLAASSAAGFTGVLRGTFYEMESRTFLREVGAAVPFLNGLLLADLGGLDRARLGRLFPEAGALYYHEFLGRRPLRWRPLAGLRIDGVDRMVAANRFQDQVGRVRVPLTFLYAHNDGLVVPGVNSDELVRRLRGAPNPFVGAIGLDRGNHCAFSSAYGWRTMGALLRARVLARDPAADHWRAVTWRRRLDLAVVSREPVGSYGWKMTAGRGEAVLRVGSRQAWRLPVTGFASLGLRPPRDAAEANRMSRWLNANTWLADGTGREITGSVAPTGLEIRARGRFEL